MFLMIIAIEVIAVTNHSNSISNLQIIPSNLNASLLSPQRAMNKSLILNFSLKLPAPPAKSAHSPMSNQVPITDATTPNVPSPTMTPSTSKTKERREREARTNSQNDQGSDISESHYLYFFRQINYQTTKKFGTLPSNETRWKPGLPGPPMNSPGRTNQRIPCTVPAW